MSDLTTATTLARHPSVLAQQVKRGEPSLVLLNPGSGEYYTLDPVGSRVWQLCDGKCTIGQIVTVLSQEFDAPSEVIETDALALLKDLLDEGLVEVPA